MTYRPRHVKHQGESLVIHEGRHIKEASTTRSTLRRAVAGTAIVAAPFAMAAPAFAEQGSNPSDESSQVETSTQQLVDFTDDQIETTDQVDAPQYTTEEAAVESSVDSEDDEFNLGYVSLETHGVDSEDNEGAEPEDQDADSSQAAETDQPNEAEAEALDQTNDNEAEVEVSDDSQSDTESADSEAEDQLADQPAESTEKTIQETDSQPEDSADDSGNETDEPAKTEPKESGKTKQDSAEKEPSPEADDASEVTEVDFGFVSLESDEESHPVESSEADNAADEKSDDEAAESDTEPDDELIDLGFTSLPDDEQAAEEVEPSNEEDEQQDQDSELDLGFTSLPESDTPSDEEDDETDSTESKAREEDNEGELDLGFTTYDSTSVEQEPAPAKEQADATEQEPAPDKEDADASEQSPKPEETVKKKSNSEIATEVLADKWGVNDDRVNRLKAAGYDPDAVQVEVNKMMDSGWLYTHELDGQVKGVIGYAIDQGDKGYTYRLGAGTQSGPTGTQFDCSSFTSSAWKDGAGIDIGRSAQQQWNNGKARGQVIAQGHSVKMSDLQPGDLIFEAAGRRGPVGDQNSVSHVTMYIGNGETVEWSHSKNGYAKRPARTSGTQIVGAIRPAAPDGSNS